MNPMTSTLVILSAAKHPYSLERLGCPMSRASRDMGVHKNRSLRP